MTLRGLIPLTIALIMATGTCGWAADEDESPRLKHRVDLNKWGRIDFCESIAFSRDGKTLLTLSMSGPTVRLWDVASEKQIAVLKHGRKRIVAADYSPDGKLLATAEHRGSLWIWDATTHKKIRSFDVHEGVAQIMFSSDSKVLSVAAEGQLHAYLLKNGELLHSRKIGSVSSTYADSVRPVASSRPIKKPMIEWGNQLFDAEKGWQCYRLSDDVFRDNAIAASIATTSDERKMAMGHGRCILLWDLTAANEDPAKRKYRILKTLRIIVHCVAFTPNDEILAVGYQDLHPFGTPGYYGGRGGVFIFDAASGKLLSNHLSGIAAVKRLAFSPDGRLLATADRDGAITLWDVPAEWRKLGKEAQ